MPTGANHARRLRALGLVPWRLRSVLDATVPEVADAAAGRAPPRAQAGPMAQDIRCVVLLPAGCAVRELDLLGRALNAYGVGLARAARITVDATGLSAALPPVRAYLAFGSAQAHALGRELPAALLAEAQIVLADPPAAILQSGAAKRRLWSAMRQLRRTLDGRSG